MRPIPMLAVHGFELKMQPSRITLRLQQINMLNKQRGHRFLARAYSQVEGACNLIAVLRSQTHQMEISAVVLLHQLYISIV